MSSCGLAVLQFGARCPGVGEGAGVGGDAGADGSRLPGMTFGLAGMGIGTDDVDAVCMLRASVRGILVPALDCRCWANSRDDDDEDEDDLAGCSDALASPAS